MSKWLRKNKTAPKPPAALSPELRALERRRANGCARDDLTVLLARVLDPETPPDERARRLVDPRIVGTLLVGVLIGLQRIFEEQREQTALIRGIKRELEMSQRWEMIRQIIGHVLSVLPTLVPVFLGVLGFLSMVQALMFAGLGVVFNVLRLLLLLLRHRR